MNGIGALILFLVIAYAVIKLAVDGGIALSDKWQNKKR